MKQQFKKKTNLQKFMLFQKYFLSSDFRLKMHFQQIFHQFYLNFNEIMYRSFYLRTRRKTFSICNFYVIWRGKH